VSAISPTTKAHVVTVPITVLEPARVCCEVVELFFELCYHVVSVQIVYEFLVSLIELVWALGIGGCIRGGCFVYYSSSSWVYVFSFLFSHNFGFLGFLRFLRFFFICAGLIYFW
jgi:hypothetical protein